MNLSVAHSTTSTLQFYNVGGGVRFTLSQDGITEVVFKGLNGEILAGKVKVGFQDGVPTILDVAEGKTSVTLTPPEGETFKKDAWYYIVTLPEALEQGFTFSFRKTGNPAPVMPSCAYPKPVTVKRGTYGVLTHVDKGIGQTVSDEVIAFQDPLVKSIVVKYFDTSSDGELSSITIPKNIESIGDNAFKGCTSLESIKATSETPPEGLDTDFGTVIWENDGTQGVIQWDSIYQFALEGSAGSDSSLATFPADTWDVIKNGTFYLLLDGASPSILIYDGWWMTYWLHQYIMPGDKRLKDNGDGTWTLEINFSGDPIQGYLDNQGFLLTGSDYTPLKLYY